MTGNASRKQAYLSSEEEPTLDTLTEVPCSKEKSTRDVKKTILAYFTFFVSMC